MNLIKKKIWQWPDGLVWRLTEGYTLKSRKRKHDLFICLMKPTPKDRILDVGVSPFHGRGTNFLELRYPYPENIIALTNDNPERFKDFNKYIPKVKLAFGDGKILGFQIVTSISSSLTRSLSMSGGEEEQARFIYEIIRVGKKAFITTPNYYFPVDAHTLIPFAHWLPQKIKFWIYKKLGRAYWTDVNHLNLLTEKKFLKFFPDELK